MGDQNEMRSVFVGYDGSPAAEQALQWGAAEARLRGLALTVCHVWHWPYPMRPPDKDTLEILRSEGAIVADEGVRKARAFAGDLEVRWCLEQGSAAAAFLKASRGAVVVVLGSRGHGGFEGLPVGSTAVQVASHASCPVVVVRSPTRLDGGRIVVGVDGSPAGDAALGFAVEEAALHHDPVTAVCGWWDPAALPGPDRVPFIDTQAVRHEAIARFERAVAPWRTERPEVLIETKFILDAPRRALVSASHGAAMLVVGVRGIGSLPQMLLGPVPQVALHEARCPVAVVPASEPGR
ncbi:universal stress protein [Actinomadura luteofluorescens]|uniref:universal stress protein n=1 Tax=Actinomadura luteofluorescens TaxID=46163 RepID=UPI002164A34A|nr:universal stress protein [Actinomadura glauciflava]MCR3743887.1 Nucleotide-binding universal stress protein, UspA family [Actinomadura glauciflava]